MNAQRYSKYGHHFRANVASNFWNSGVSFAISDASHHALTARPCRVESGWLTRLADFLRPTSGSRAANFPLAVSKPTSIYRGGQLP